MTNIFKGYGIEVFVEAQNFLKLKETLSRIGILSSKDKTLYQSCHILHKQGRYVIIHFKELFALDFKSTDISDNDIARRNTITKLLADWGLLEIKTPSENSDLLVSISDLKIIPYKEKSNYILVSKYNIGKHKIT